MQVPEIYFRLVFLLCACWKSCHKSLPCFYKHWSIDICPVFCFTSLTFICTLKTLSYTRLKPQPQPWYMVTYFGGLKNKLVHSWRPQPWQYTVASCRFSSFYWHGIKHVNSPEEYEILSHATLLASILLIQSQSCTLVLDQYDLYTLWSILIAHSIWISSWAAC